MKVKRNVLGALLAIAAVLGLLPAGCRNPASSSAPEPSSGATGRITVSIGIEGAESRNADGARTAAPAIDGTTFSTYTLSFVKAGGGTVPDVNLTPNTISQAVELPVGTYTVTVTAYVSGTETAIAQGSAGGVAVTDGGETPVTLTLGPTAGGAQGALSYSITVPAETAGTLAITTLTGGTVSGIGAAALAAGTENSGTKNLDPGYYRVQIALTRNGKSAGHTEVVHIYTGLTSTFTKVFAGSDFAAGGTPADPTSSLGLTISFNYGPITLTADSGPYTIRKKGTPSSLTLSAPAGYTSIAWYLDGNSTAAGTSNSITLEASALALKPYSITFIGVKDGKPYSQVVPFTVEDGDSGTGGGSVSAAELAGYLEGLSDNGVNSPHTVVFGSSVDVTDDEWGGDIKDALTGNTKYLILDLSACSAAGNTISGANSPSGNNFNVIKSDKIVGIILPSGLTAIGSSALAGFTGLTSITIPSGVTSIGDTAFWNCTSLTGIAIPSGVTSIEMSTFNACSSLTSITIPSGVTSIGMNAFNGCTSLTGITFPAGESITIDSYAFTNCGFASITIPARVTFIAGSGFSNCAKLTTVIFEGAVTLIGDNNSFPNGQTLKTAYESGKAGTYVRNGTTNFDTWGKS